MRKRLRPTSLSSLLLARTQLLQVVALLLQEVGGLRAIVKVEVLAVLVDCAPSRAGSSLRRRARKEAVVAAAARAQKSAALGRHAQRAMVHERGKGRGNGLSQKQTVSLLCRNRRQEQRRSARVEVLK